MFAPLLCRAPSVSIAGDEERRGTEPYKPRITYHIQEADRGSGERDKRQDKGQWSGDAGGGEGAGRGDGRSRDKRRGRGHGERRGLSRDRRQGRADSNTRQPTGAGVMVSQPASQPTHRDPILTSQSMDPHHARLHPYPSLAWAGDHEKYPVSNTVR